MTKEYYVLLERDPDSLMWGVQFGDYERDTCVFERNDRRDAHDYKRGTKMRIVKTDDSQKSIDELVHRWNWPTSG